MVTFVFHFELIPVCPKCNWAGAVRRGAERAPGAAGGGRQPARGLRARALSGPARLGLPRAQRGRARAQAPDTHTGETLRVQSNTWGNPFIFMYISNLKIITEPVENVVEKLMFK